MVRVEVEAGSLRRDNFEQEANEVNQMLHPDMGQEVRRESQIRKAAYQQRTSRFYDSKVKVKSLKVGDLVLCKMMPGMNLSGHGASGANWEKPYRIRCEIFGGTHRLEHLQGNSSWRYTLRRIMREDLRQALRYKLKAEDPRHVLGYRSETQDKLRGQVEDPGQVPGYRLKTHDKLRVQVGDPEHAPKYKSKT